MRTLAESTITADATTPHLANGASTNDPRLSQRQVLPAARGDFLDRCRGAACADAAGSGLPWETPLTTITTSLTGPVATAVAIIAMFAAGAALVFGDEMSGFVKRILVGVMALSLLIFSSRFLSVLGLSGFTI
jgi:type IV secretory pathway VirB2 component (pilin)